ncbi:MAG: MarR family transcriptional regulator [Promethearchaeota archaeon]
MIVNDIYSVLDYGTRKRLISLAPSSKFILYLLKQRGPLNQKDILKKTLLPKRTVAYSLKKLEDENFIRKSIDTNDKRIRIYQTIV